MRPYNCKEVYLKFVKMLGLLHQSEIPLSTVRLSEFEWFSFYTFPWDLEPVRRTLERDGNIFKLL